MLLRPTHVHKYYKFVVVPWMFEGSDLEMSGNIFFNPIPSHSQWFIPIPIPNPMFSLVLFPFPLIIPIHSRSHSGTASSISIRKQMTNKLNNAHN